MMKKCEICGDSFSVRPYRKNTARFCSFRCGGVWHATHRLPKIVSKRMRGNRYRAGKRPANAFVEKHVPWNAGLTGIHLSKKTEFKKGCKSHRKLPIGSVSIRTDKNGNDRAHIKTANPRTWKPRAIHVWETHFGKVPMGCVIHHHDRNTLNDDIDNLRCLTRRAHVLEHGGDRK